MVKILVNIIRDLSSRLNQRFDNWQVSHQTALQCLISHVAAEKKDRDFAFQTLLFEAEFSRPSIIVRNFEVYIQNLNAT